MNKFAPVTPAQPALDLPFTEFERRIKKLPALRRKLQLDALLLRTEVNLYYLTGLSSDNAILVAADGEPTFYTDFRYIVMAKRKAPGLKCELMWPAKNHADALAKMGKKWRRVGYEGNITASRFNALREALPDVELVNVSNELMEMRSVKSPAEQRVMRGAIAANDKVYQALRAYAKPGMTEWVLATFFRMMAWQLGQGEAFDTIVCAGRNGAECHHEPDNTELRAGQPVLVDQGVRLNHYCSDMTRCFCLGKPSAAYRNIYRVVYEANRAAIRAIKPGMVCGDIDAIARNYIDRAGYGKAFGHSLGHSLGLEIHESPGFSPGCKTVLKPGMLITVEPGIYLPGRLGIRHEDVVLVTKTGCEVLSKSPPLED